MKIVLNDLTNSIQENLLQLIGLYLFKKINFIFLMKYLEDNLLIIFPKTLLIFKILILKSKLDLFF